jgi:hypothetical protein
MRVVFDPRLLATGVAFAQTPARQLLVIAGWAKLVAVNACSDADLAAQQGVTLEGAPGVAVSDSELAWIRARLPDGLPDNLGLVSSDPLMHVAAAQTAAFFDDYPALRPKAEGIRLDCLAVDFVDVPPAVNDTQDVLLHCGLEGAEVMVSDHHPIVVASRGAQQLVEDRGTGRQVVTMGSAALAGTMGRAFRFVHDDLLADICMLLRPGRDGA